MNPVVLGLFLGASYLIAIFLGLRGLAILFDMPWFDIIGVLVKEVMRSERAMGTVDDGDGDEHRSDVRMGRVEYA